MDNSKGPRQQFPVERVLASIVDLEYLNLTLAFDGLEEGEKQWQLREYCTGLILAVKHPSEHLKRLDEHLTTLVPHALSQYPGLVMSFTSSRTGNDLIGKANNLLARLPKVPQRLFTLPFNNSRLSSNQGSIWDGIKDGRWSEKYVIPEARSKLRLHDHDDPAGMMQLLEDMQDIAWDNLYVTSFIDTNNTVFALKVADLGHQPDLNFAQNFRAYINLIGELIDEYDAIVDAASFGFKDPFEDPAPSVQALKHALFPQAVDDDHEQSLSVLKAFLWSAWQRSVMLYFYYVLGVQLWEGSSSIWSSFFAIRGVRRLIDLEAQDYRGDGAHYLCNWAFEMLRTTRTSLGLDFRRMISLFDQHFRELPGRCIPNSELSCRGDLPQSCQRFTNAETKSQSMHAINCSGDCDRIRWSELSYRQCESPRAVRVGREDIRAGREDKTLLFCKASSQTMAISHVWSHGQGGRPEDGINACLHKRYCDLASSYCCDSYWIDSTCIPDDPYLRKEAIAKINDIFSHSKITLISDKDLQSMEFDPNVTEDYETLLSILLVCDWGVRAWTMLEAIRGNESIYILCAGDESIGLIDLLRKVHEKGAIDLAVLLGGAQHLLPSSKSESAKPIEEVGHLLSQRHASRKDDEIVIWGLLSNLQAPQDVLQFWKTNKQVNTAFLISSAPRLKSSLGYQWAPETPYIRPQRREVRLNEHALHVYSVRYPSYDGRGSYVGHITPRGLQSLWLVHDLDQNFVSSLCDTVVQEMIPNQWTDRDAADPPIVGDYDEDSLMYERPDYANACFLLKALSDLRDTKVRIIRPLSYRGTEPYHDNADRGENFSTLIAICVCYGSQATTVGYSRSGDTNRNEWQWKGVYEWQDDTHPDWSIQDMLII